MKPLESFIGQPVRSLQTMLHVIAKDDPVQPDVVPDGIYGPLTSQSVAAFQRRHGYPPTGIADQQTWDGIVQDYEPALIRVDKAQPIEVIINPGQVFRKGDSSPYIYLLQSMLTQLAKDHTMIQAPEHNGIMDDSTAAALAAFQQISSLPETGDLDKVTWKHIVHQFTLNAHANANKNINSNY